MGWITLVWSAVAVLTGVLVGAFWSDLRRTQRSEELSRSSERIRALDGKADHFAFGITDLDVRIRAANNEIAMLRSDLKVRRASYDRLNAQLRECWDEAIECKRALAGQEQSEAELKAEIEKWKHKLDTLYKRMDAGHMSDRALKRELAAGLSAIFAEAGDELPTVQRLLLENTIDIGISGDTEHQGYREIVGLLSARIELLETQVRYWQDRSTGQISDDLPPPTEPAEACEVQELLAFDAKAAPVIPTDEKAAAPLRANRSNKRQKAKAKSAPNTSAKSKKKRNTASSRGKTVANGRSDSRTA